LSEEQPAKYEVELIHDRQRTARFYPDSPFQKRSQEIPENRSQRDRKAAEQEVTVDR